MIDDSFDLLMSMSSLSRYSQTHLIKDESVLEHTGFVCMIAYIIGSKIDGVKMDALLSRAVVHDVDEIITGDIPRPTKYANPEIAKAIKDVEVENMKVISNKILGNNRMFEDWAHSKDSTIEGHIIALADCLSVLYKIWQESVLYNNKTIIGHLRGVDETLNKMYYGSHQDLKKYIDSALSISDLIRKKTNGN